jgi:spermidine synthase
MARRTATSRQARRQPRPAERRQRTRLAAPAFTDREPWLVPVLGGAFLVSGAAGLIHEVVWTRLLGHVFGVSLLAISTVLGAYMAGLALGSWWMGSRVERFADQRRVYAWLELAIGLFALAVPGLLGLMEPAYGWLWREFRLSFGVFSILRFVAAGAVLLVPTFMMGATLPALAEYLARREGRHLAPEWLYTLNLLGAVLGTAIAGFVLMPGVGVWGTILTGVALNLAVAISVLTLPTTPREAGEEAPGVSKRAAAEEEDGDEEGGAVRLPPVLVASAFASGLLSLATQVAWNRVLVLIVGSTTYAFSTVLLVYLTALGLGAALVSRLGPRIRRTGASRALCLAFVAGAALTLIAVWLADRLPAIYMSLYAISERAELSGLILRGLISGFVVLFPPVLAAGTILPLTIMASAPEDGRGTGRAVGRVYAINTIGSIVGSVLGGFVLVPFLGSQHTLLGLGAVSAAMGAVFLTQAERPGWLRPATVATAIAVLLGFLLLPAWNQALLHAGVFEPGRYGPSMEGILDDSGEKTIFHREGLSASVLVSDFSSGVRSMRIDGRSNASTHPGDMSTQSMLALVPLLLAPRVNDVFIVGWGSGVTVGTALQFAVEHVTAVELEPAVVEASRYFKEVNHDPESDERLELLLDDARHILLATDRSYDVIISEPPHPWVAGVANLFTQDFYRIAAKRLRPGGIFSQWVQSYELTLDTYRTILATFTSVFPETMIFYTPGTTDTVLVGSREPLRIDLERLAERWNEPAVRAVLEGMGITAPEYVVAAAALGPEQVRALAQGAPINTDDNMLIEFGAAAGSLSATQIWEELERRAAGPEAVTNDPDQILASPLRLRAYAEGLVLVDRQPRRYLQQLGEPEGGAPSADDAPSAPEQAAMPE